MEPMPIDPEKLDDVLACGTCSHATDWHRDPETAEPVPCRMVVGTRSIRKGGAKYDYCDCETQHTLAQDRARRSRRESTR